MGAPVSDVQAGDQPTAESLLKAFKTIDAAERRRHASVLNYWLSIRGDRELPPLHDLDPLEISDAAPSSLLLELIGGGEDAEIRHMGELLKAHGVAERIIDAPRPSLLASIAAKLSIVAISRNALSFEDEFETADGTTRCWVTLLPLSSAGAWVDYVYGFVSASGDVADMPAAAEAVAGEAVAEEVVAEETVTEEAVVEETVDDEPVGAVEDAVVDAEPSPIDAEEPEPLVLEDEVQPADELVAEDLVAEDSGATVVEGEDSDEPRAAPGFSKLIDSLAGLTGFYGSNAKAEPQRAAGPTGDPEANDPEPVVPADQAPMELEEPVAEVIEEVVAEEPVEAAEPEAFESVAEIVDDPVIELTDEVPATPADDEIVEEPAVAEAPAGAMEGTLQSKLEDVRGKADEARLAKLRSNTALYEGLSAAYDFALDAEEAPEEYLKLVEAKGLKIQLRSPMRPVVKLAFDGMCDDHTISQLEAVLAWALEHDLPRGSLAERIESEGGIAPILNEFAKAA